MGNKEVKPVIISYDDAVKRVSATELRRLRETFKRVCSGTMSLHVFMREVLGDGVPHSIAEQIFCAFGGNGGRNLTFKELLCGLVLFTRARDSNDEKIKFIFGLYADDNLRVHKQVIDDVILKTDGQIPESLSELFEHRDEVDYHIFKRWLLLYPEFSYLSYWLILEPCASTLTAANELQSFYQTLSGVTHLNESEIVYLEGNYNKLRATATSGRFDLELFRKLVSPPLPRQLTGSLYKAFDENMDGHIDFKEMVCGLSACCKGPEAERQKFCFKVFDLDKDGFLSKAELIGAIEASFSVLEQNDNSENQSLSSSSSSVADLIEMDAYTLAGEILEAHGCVKEGRLSQAEFLVWAVQSKVPQGFSELLFEVCHIILGMKPVSRENEGRVVKGWLSREVKRGYTLGQTWFLISSSWWRRWLDYVSDNVVLEAIELEHTYESVSISRDVHDRRYSERMNGEVKLYHPARPGPIDNSHLIIHEHSKLPRWTNGGGTLRPYIQQGKDYQLIPELLWNTLHSWYQGEVQLPRPIIVPNKEGSKVPEVELYSLNVKLYKHQLPHQAHQPVTTVAGVTGGIANFAMSMTGYQTNIPKRVHISNAAFSHQHSLRQILDFLSQKLKVQRDDLRLWKYHHENDLELLEGEEKLLEELAIVNGQSILMEVQNPDLTWPEEMLQILKRHTKKQETHVESGTTGLSNLGNTCFMNTAIQCVSNCQPLTMYFRLNIHLYELNRANPLGTKGRLAQLYAKLITSLWDGTNKNLPPVELRYTLAKYAPQFTGCQQHDAQELLSFLLDGLHEDLNRVQNKPYVELKDSDGRPDDVLAKEGWDYHLSRNQSIIVDLFHGQLKSIVKCQTCSHSSIRFDPFTYLSLPLPMENSLLLEVVVISQNGAVPVRYGIRLNSDDRYSDVREPLSKLTDIAKDLLLFVELYGAYVKSFPLDSQKIKQRIGSGQPLHAYELEKPLLQEHEDSCDQTQCNGLTTSTVSTLSSGSTQMNGTVPKENGIAGVSLPSNGTFGHKKSGEGPNNSPRNTLKQSFVGNGSTGTLTSNQSANSTSTHIDTIQTEATKPDGLVVAMHRKMERQEYYFMASQQTVPCMFGTPVILQINSGTTQRDLYHSVWTMIKRFVTGHPVTESCNHAQDCDGSLGNEYPFILLKTKRCGTICSKCPFYKFCRGCLIDYSDDLFNSQTDYIAIDWDSTAYYLRYQASPDTVHSSINDVYNSDDPVNIQKCLEAFTKEEQLAEDELYFCSKCKQHRVATKKLEIWRLPFVLIIHLKRFQFLSNRWVKSQKLVDFPMKDFDPGSYLVQRSLAADLDSVPTTPLNSGDHPFLTPNGSITPSKDMETGESLKRSKTHSVTSCDSLDYSQTKYDLHAVSCHRGNLGGGHYVACTKNPNGKWYEYNDSMVKELPESSVAQTNQRNCYILFYERQELNYHKLLPNVSGRKMDDAGLDEEFNTELSKAASCLIQ